MSYTIQLDNFEGPLDLLLYFIRRDELDIYDIPIAKITRDFIGVIEQWKKLNIVIAGDFIVMASTLMRIKAKIMIPRPDLDDDGDGFSEFDGDCNDQDSRVNPEESEICDSIDNNCNNEIDEQGGDENLIDGYGPNGISKIISLGSYYLSRFQSGYLFHYAFAMLGGLVIILTWFIYY